MEIGKLTARDRQAMAEYGLLGSEVEGEILHFTYKRKERLCEAGAPLEHLLLLTGGRCKVVSTLANGNQVLLGFYDAESTGAFGDMEFLSGTPLTSDVWAVSDVSCIAIPLTAPVVKCVHGNLVFYRRVAQGMATKFRLTCDNNSVRLLTSLEERLCAYIYMTQDGGVFHENLTELANLLATSYRHLMRTLRGLCARGVLRGERGVYTVLDEEYLAGHGIDTPLAAIRPDIG